MKSIFVLCRSFSELYQKAIKDAECKPGENQSGEAWVLEEREEDGEDLKDKGRVSTVDITQGHVEGGNGNEQPADKMQSEKSQDLLLTLPSLPLLRATSLQDQPANQSQEVSASQLTRSYSLERQPSFKDTCDE